MIFNVVSNATRLRRWAGWRLFATVVLLGLVSTAQADWSTILPVTGTAGLDNATFYRLYPSTWQIAAQHSAGFDLLGPRLLSFARDGRLLDVGVQSLAGAEYDTFDRLVRTDGGTFIASSDTLGVAAFGADGGLRWSAYTGGSRASAPLVADDGSLTYAKSHYVGTQNDVVHLHRLLPDGSSGLDRSIGLEQALGRLGEVSELQLLQWPRNVDLLIVGNYANDSFFAARVSPQGQLRWHWSALGRLDRFAGITLAMLPEGGVLLGLKSREIDEWTIHTIDSDGAARNVGTFRPERRYGGEHIAISKQGRVYQYQAGHDGMVLIGRDATGRELWRVEGVKGCAGAYCTVFATTNGDLWVSGHDGDGFVLERYTPDGRVRFAHRARDFSPGVLLGTVLGEPDADHMLVALRRRTDESIGGPPARVWDEWVAFDLQGVTRARVELPALHATPMAPPALVRDAEGTTHVIGATRDNARDRIEVVDAMGRHVGGADLDLRDDYGGVFRAAMCGSALCVAHDFGVKAYSESGRGPGIWRTRTADRIHSLYAFGNGATLLQHYRTVPNLEYGELSIPLLQMLDPAGRPLLVPAGATYVESFDSELGALVHVEGVPMRLRADATLVPAAALPDVAMLGDDPARQRREKTRTLALPGGDTALLAVYASYEDLSHFWQSRTLRVVRVGADGNVRWRRDITGFGRGSDLAMSDVALSASPAGDLLLSARYPSNGAIRLTALRGNDGRVLTQRTVACPGTTCETQDFSAGMHGVVFGFARAGSAPDSGHVVLRIDGLFDDEQIAAQPALSGVWYSPESVGQGVVVQAEDDGRLALAWFTHAGSTQQDPAMLRWYTMAGHTTSSEKEVALTVHSVRGGAFAAPSTATVEEVGTARLWLADCGRLELRVRFADGYTVGGVAAGSGGEYSFTLQRLLPSTDPCTAADGSVLPPPRHADRRISGLWYEPTASGQGLFLHRIEPAADAPALLVGAWFTHDAPGSGNASTDSVHWFTLRGEEDPGDGTMAMVIDQTLGGHLSGTATRNTMRVGRATLQAMDCNRLDFSYRFDDSEVARVYRTRSGTIALQRLGDSCRP